MKSLEKPVFDPRFNPIQLNGPRSSYSARKNDSIKSQIDVILQKDYSNWRVTKNKFDALNSLTSKSSEVIRSYVKGIYVDYHIQDPLEEKNAKPKGISILNQQYDQNIRPLDTRFNRETIFPEHKISDLHNFQRNAYVTPTKTTKKGLQLTNNLSEVKKNVTFSEQRPQMANVFVNFQNQITPTKIKFDGHERTAHSFHDSSFALSNSRNLNPNSQQMYYSPIKREGPKDSLTINSRISLANRLFTQVPSQNNIISNRALQEQFQPLSTEFKSTREFLNRRKGQTIISQKDITDQPIGSEVSLGENNPERQQLRLKNQQYASQFIQVGRRKILFVPEQKIKQSFRYCVGCQAAVLEANLLNHEEQCRQFKRILNIQRVQDILIELNKKIYGIGDKIIQKQAIINEKDPQKITESSRILVDETKKALKGGIRVEDFIKLQPFDKQYENVIEIGTKWGTLTEEVNKLNWFLLVKRNFQSLRIQKRQSI